MIGGNTVWIIYADGRVLDVEVDFGQSTLEFEGEDTGSIPMRGPSIWGSLQSGGEGQLLTAHGPGAALTWEDPPESGGGLSDGWSIDSQASLHYGGLGDSYGAVINVSRSHPGQDLDMLLDNSGSTGRARLTLYTSSQGQFTQLTAGNGFSEWYTNTNTGFRGVEAYFGCLDRWAIHVTASVFDLLEEFDAKKGCVIRLPEGKKIDVLNGSGQRIFRVDENGNVDAAGVITGELGAGFS